MIERIEGIVQEITDHKVVIQSHSISWGILVPKSHEYTLDQKISLFIYLYWNQEQGPSLYGFQTPLERAIFTLIIDCNGIGPKLAIAILHTLGTSGFLQAITMHDDRILSKVSGIGAKKAEQIIVQLKHKVQKLISSGDIDMNGETITSTWHDVDQALSSLNYSRQEINRTLDAIKKDQDVQTLAFDQLLRRALAHIARKQ